MAVVAGEPTTATIGDVDDIDEECEDMVLLAANGPVGIASR